MGMARNLLSKTLWRRTRSMRVWRAQWVCLYVCVRVCLCYETTILANWILIFFRSQEWKSQRLLPASSSNKILEMELAMNIIEYVIWAWLHTIKNERSMNVCSIPSQRQETLDKLWFTKYQQKITIRYWMGHFSVLLSKHVLFAINQAYFNYPDTFNLTCE